MIDEEIRQFVDTAEATARKILTDRIDDLHTVAGALLEYETISGDELQALLRGETIFRPTDEEPPKDAGRRSTVPSSGAMICSPIARKGLTVGTS